MSSRIGSWLAAGGPAPAPEPAVDQPTTAGAGFPGERYGLPETGLRSVASMGRRAGAFVVDCVVAGLITSLLVHLHVLPAGSMQAQNYWAILVWAVISVLSTSVSGFTPGMALFGIRIVRLDGRPMLLPLRALVRVALVAVIIPAAIWDLDHRGLQDKVAGTLVITMR